MHPGFYSLSSVWVTGIASGLAAASSRLAAVSSWLTGVFPWLAWAYSRLVGVFSWLSGVFLAGWSFFWLAELDSLSGSLEGFPVWLESFPVWLEFSLGWLEPLAGWLESGLRAVRCGVVQHVV